MPIFFTVSQKIQTFQKTAFHDKVCLVLKSSQLYRAFIFPNLSDLNRYIVLCSTVYVLTVYVSYNFVSRIDIYMKASFRRFLTGA